MLQPAGLVLDGYGYLYVADAGANDIVRIDTENGNQAAAVGTVIDERYGRGLRGLLHRNTD